jgi:predicted amidohydrolase YtcJ
MAARLTGFLVCTIVSATVIAGLIVGAQNDASGPVDLIIYNGRVFTGASSPPQEALAVRGNRILRVGTNREIKRLRRKPTLVIDAHGASVLPGLNDASANLIERGLAAQAAAEPAPFAVATPKPAAVEADRPSKAARATLPAELTREERVGAIRAAIDAAHRAGVTSVQYRGADVKDLELLDELRSQDDLALRVYVALAANADLDDDALARLETVRSRTTDDPLLRTGAVALTGAPAASERPARRAARRERARDAETMARTNADTFKRAVARLDKRDWQVILTAANDEELTAALDAISHAREANGIPSRGRRHRVELSTPILEDIAALSAPDVVTTVSADSPLLWQLVGATGPLTLGTVSGAVLETDPLTALFDAVQATDAPASGLALLVDAATRGAAYASFDEQRKGVLATDMLADIVVLSADVFALPPAERAGVGVELTIFDGRVVYTREPASPATTE